MNDFTYDEGSAWTQLLFAAIREVVPRDIASEIASVQPMPMPSALIDLLHNRYSKTYEEYGPDEDEE